MPSSTEAALVRRPPRGSQLEFARSLRDAEPNQFIALSNDGAVLSRRATMTTGLKLGVVGGVAIYGLGWVGGMVAPMATGVAALGLLAGLAWWLRGYTALRSALRPFADNELDEVASRLDALRGRWLPPGIRAHVHHLRGSVHWRRGELALALAQKDATIEMTRNARPAGTRVAYWLALFDRTQLLAVTGELAAAHEAAAELEHAPRGDFFEMEQRHTRLTLAFHDGSLDGLPGDLIEWVRAALETNMWGGTLVLLSWAYACRGDEDMAAHLLQESQDRLTNWYLDRTYPRVYAWMRQRLAAMTPETSV